ncbi:MAG: TlpA disulfide reductase family protein [Candidatus Krumholzibacteria bacterium]|nr:TlpA disulfide reductase family protein [Candidatus Krumholzibacteria bacterium]
MLQGLTIRSARAALVLAAALVIALGPAGCAKKKEEPKQKALERTESTPNVTISSYTTAPDVELKMLDGTSEQLSIYRGDIVILTFLATWNKESAAQVAELNKLQAKLQRYRFAILGVFTDKNGKAEVENFIKKNPVSFFVYYNGDEVVEAFGGMRRIPTTYILLRDGSIYAKEAGFRSMRQIEAFTLQINAQRL